MSSELDARKFVNSGKTSKLEIAGGGTTEGHLRKGRWLLFCSLYAWTNLNEQCWFQKAKAEIELSGDLQTVTEARSRILVLMTYGACHSICDPKSHRLDATLEEAEDLIEQIPTKKTSTSTVFSTISKKNEDHSIKRSHLGKIRDGGVLSV